MSEFFDKLTSKSKELFSAAKDTANDLIEKGKDKAEEMKLNHDLSDTYAKLGELFFEKELEPLEVSEEDLLDEPETIIQNEEDEDGEDGQQPNDDSQEPDDPFFNNAPQQQNNGYMEFDDDFWH